MAASAAKPLEPNLSHLSSRDFEGVYEPAEDTFLLMDALAAEVPRLRAVRGAAPLVLEVGSGSGAVSAFASLLLRPCFNLAVDVNPLAARATQATFRANGVVGDVLVGDLATALEPRLRGRVDLLLFNPPYVPTPPEELGKDDIYAAWAGGARGRQVTDRFLPHAPALLAPGGVMLLVAVEENAPEELLAAMRDAGLSAEVAARRRAGRERLSVLRFQRAAHGELEKHPTRPLQEKT
jgi:release factor glutamine methyltransferase